VTSIHRAPGRICLVGEHCDWAGGAALVVPLDRFVSVRASRAPAFSARSIFEGRAVATGDIASPLRYVDAVADELHSRLGAPVAAALEITSDLPAGRGFSSSAALCVASARALAAAAGVEWDADTLAEIAYAAERTRLGVHCGRMDPLACAHAVPLFLDFGGDTPSVEPLAAALSLAVGSSSAPRDTPRILSELARYHAGEVPLRDPSAVAAVGAVRGAIEGFAAQARIARDALRANDVRAVGAAMDVAQEIYEDDLGTAISRLHAPRVVRAVRALRAAGALGAKFTGAGGEGAVVGLYAPGDPRLAEGVAALDALGWDAFPVEGWWPT
jgi:galactokinase